MNMIRRMIEQLHREMYATNHEMQQTAGINNIRHAGILPFKYAPVSSATLTIENMYQFAYQMTGDERYNIYPKRYKIQFEDVD